ncbi:glycoside hydrolase family 18 protein [Sporormia fimetaria CBS 119925]|uniref:chitinase n=1 Tax=Sporormia fimetaria CBS 119925 TaxID=1340428 RepID=A0A6A6V3C9_9PLEO|nr:glycoside hydrolase family 18 protein [Sporormia fimetaria CBS 119925]
MKAIRNCTQWGSGICLLFAAVTVAQNCGPRCREIRREIEAIQDALRWIDEELPYVQKEVPIGAIKNFVEDNTCTLSCRGPLQAYTSVFLDSIAKICAVEDSIGIPTSTASASPSSRPPTVGSPPEPSRSVDPAPIPLPTMPAQEGYRSVAYFTNWGIYARGYTPDKVPVENLTHILYAFGDNKEDGTVVLTDTWSDIEKHYEGDSWNDVGKNIYGSLKQLNLAKRRNRNLKVLLSIGGWTYTNTQKHMDGPASSPEGRRSFAASCVQMIRDFGFDGIDIDWEYPQNPGQGEQLLLLLQEIRNQMDAYARKLAQSTGNTNERGAPGETAPHFVLSIAAPAGKSNYQNLPLDRLDGPLDFINLMGYDFSGSWDAVAGHQANLYPSKDCPQCTPYNIHSVIDDYTKAGIPADKIVLGMPLYGRAFTNTTGFGQPYSGVGEGNWEAGIWDYKVLPKAGAVEYLDKEVGASYSYDENTQTLVSYDTVEMARIKASYIKQRNLGGAMWWELSGDRNDTEGSIIANVVNDLGGPSRKGLEYAPNWLLYPDSQYDNVRDGFPNNQ